MANEELYPPGFTPIGPKLDMSAMPASPDVSEYPPGFTPIGPKLDMSALAARADEPSAGYAPIQAQPQQALQDLQAMSGDDMMQSLTLGPQIVPALNKGLGALREFLQPAANNLTRLPYDVAAALGVPGLQGTKRPLFTGLGFDPSPDAAAARRPIENTVGGLVSGMVNPVPGDVPQLGALAGSMIMPGVSALAAGRNLAGRAIPYVTGPLERLGERTAARIAGAGVGGATGELAQGGSPAQAAITGVEQAGGATVGEGVGKAGSGLTRWLLKNTINNRMANALVDVFSDANPAIGEAVRGQQVSQELRGGRAMAQLTQAATEGHIQRAASNRMQEHIDNINAIAANPEYEITGPIKQAWNLTPDLIKEQIVQETRPGTRSVSIMDPRRETVNVGPPRLTLEQLQLVRSYIGSQAFKEGQPALTKAAREQLVSQVTDAVEAALPKEAVATWRQANKEYGAAMVLNDFTKSANSSQDLPNRMFFNRSTFSKYLRDSAEELRARLGNNVYDAAVQQVLGGAQPGTRDILAPGSGMPLSALWQVFGRMRGGSPSAPAAVIKGFLPNFGSEYTGRQPFALPESVQTLGNVLGQRGVSTLEEARRRGVNVNPNTP